MKFQMKVEALNPHFHQDDAKEGEEPTKPQHLGTQIVLNGHVGGDTAELGDGDPQARLALFVEAGKDVTLSVGQVVTVTIE